MRTDWWGVIRLLSRCCQDGDTCILRGAVKDQRLIRKGSALDGFTNVVLAANIVCRGNPQAAREKIYDELELQRNIYLNLHST